MSTRENIRLIAGAPLFACYVPVINQKPDDDTFYFHYKRTVDMCLKYFQNWTRDKAKMSWTDTKMD